MTTILRTEQLVKTYGKENQAVKAVDRVNIEIHKGEFVALVGPSGSGKTTLLAMLAALLFPTSGEIYIDGQNLVKMSEKERTRFRREKIGFTFQSNNLVPFLTALENVELMLRLNSSLGKDGRGRAAELLERLGLGDSLEQPAQPVIRRAAAEGGDRPGADSPASPGAGR